MKYLILIGFIMASGCSTYQEKVYSDHSHPYSDISPSFMAQEPRSVRARGEEPSKFFYNECNPTGESSFNSKTSYFCEDTRH